MNSKRRLALTVIGFWSNIFLLHAQVPQLINYQGRIVTGGTNFDGLGGFKFAFVNAAGSVSLWSNDGTSMAGSQPAAQVTLTVTKGLYSVLLGDTSIAGMTVAIPATVFTNSDVRLRVWFNDNVAGFQQLTPDQRIAAVGYAMMGANVPDGTITSEKIAAGAVGTTQLADGAVTGGKIGPGAVTSATLADTLALGNPSNAVGRLDIYRALSSNAPAISLLGSANQISTFGDDGLEQIRLWGPTWGEVLLFDSAPANHQVVRLSANGSAGGLLQLSSTNANPNIEMRGEFSAGDDAAWVTFRDAGAERISFAARNDSTGRGGLIDVKNDSAANTLRLVGDTGSGRGAMEVYNGSTLVGDFQAHAGGAWIHTYDESGALTTTVGSSSLAGGFCELRNASGQVGLRLDGDDGGGGLIQVRNAAGAVTISVDGDVSGDGRVTTQELQITGGSDLSEQFNIKAINQAVQPGMVVCIDPKKPGELVMSTKAYDRTAAGVVSGAGGVKPGMLMGQKGTVADGQHPVALTGRVYCMVDTCNGPIEPGDLITTSETPGHGMRVSDHAKAQGAIIGKAMTGLEKGKGLVLVLVTLQ
jgi:hypothetical protein